METIALPAPPPYREVDFSLKVREPEEHADQLADSAGTGYLVFALIAGAATGAYLRNGGPAFSPTEVSLTLTALAVLLVPLFFLVKWKVWHLVMATTHRSAEGRRYHECLDEKRKADEELRALPIPCLCGFKMEGTVGGVPCDGLKVTDVVFQPDLDGLPEYWHRMGADTWEQWGLSLESPPQAAILTFDASEWMNFPDAQAWTPHLRGAMTVRSVTLMDGTVIIPEREDA